MHLYGTNFWTDVLVFLHLFLNTFSLDVVKKVNDEDQSRRRQSHINGYNISPIRVEDEEEPSDIIAADKMTDIDDNLSIPIPIFTDNNPQSFIQYGAVPVNRDVSMLREASMPPIRGVAIINNEENYSSSPEAALRMVKIKKDVKHDSGEDIKMLLEEKYKFRNDETSTRYRITNDDREFPVFPEHRDDRQIAWAFRSYAVRRIVGGMETSISMYPYNVAISRNGKHWCGGSIIDEQWVLTAGHCFESAVDGDKKKLVPFIVRAGSSFHNRGGYQARVNKVFFPSTYVPGSADYDFSLLRLDRPMPIGRNIAVLNLPSKDYVMKEEDILIVTGWGSTDESGYGHIPDRLRFVPVPVMRLDDCQKSYRFYITPRMLCAGYATGGKDACNHDSGGPAVRDGVLLGIVSFGGKQCGDPRSPGVYSRVAEVTDWVEKTITKNEANAVPELKEKIQKARLRERELQKFKARVEDKKNKIKNWLRETLKSPSFIQLAKKKLKQAGFNMRKSFNTRRTDFNLTTFLLDDRTMDEINLSNQINDQILEADGGDNNEAEKLIRTLALQEVMLGKTSGERFEGESEWKMPDKDNDANVSIDTLIAYVTEE